MGEIIKRENINAFVQKLKKEGKKIVTTNGCFDILHVGHIRYLAKTKNFADVLILLLNSDKSVKTIKGDGRPVNTENDRAEVLCALNSVDYVILFDEESPKSLIKKIKPDIHTKGADYTQKSFPEADAVLQNGGRIEFIEFVEGKSTTGLIEAIKKT